MYKKRRKNLRRILFVIVAFAMISRTSVAKAADLDKKVVSPTSTKIVVEGNEEEFEAYLIEGNNYLKLRDLAQALSKNKAEKVFDVGWDEGKRAINLVSGNTYTSLGGELQRGDGQDKEALINKSKIFKDGREIELQAYNIAGNNFFKLRDIAEAFDLGLSWIESTRTAAIDSTRGYDPEDNKTIDTSRVEEEMEEQGKLFIGRASGYFVSPDRKDMALLYGTDEHFNRNLEIILVDGLTGEIISHTRESNTSAVGVGTEIGSFDETGQGDDRVYLYGYAGGSGTPHVVALYKFTGGELERIHLDEDDCDAQLIFKDNFKFEVRSDKLNKSLEYDLYEEDKPYYFTKGIYNRGGKFIAHQNSVGYGYAAYSIVKNPGREDHVLLTNPAWDTYENGTIIGLIKYYYKLDGNKLVLVDIEVER